MIATLKPWAFVLMGLFLIMWAFKRFVSINNPIYESVMAVFAILAGILFLLPG